MTGFGLAIFFYAFGRLRLWRAIGDTPTAKARSAPMGLVELSGLAELDQGPLQGPLTGVDCAWWRFTIEEERTRLNSKGRTERYWDTLADERSDATFFIKDPTGRVRINPAGAEVESPPRLKRTCGGLFSSARPTGPKVALYPGGWGRRMRYTEWRVEPQRPLYALGFLQSARPSAEAEERVILVKGRNDEPFYLATMSEAEARRRLLWSMSASLFGGVLFFAVGVFLLVGLF